MSGASKGEQEAMQRLIEVVKKTDRITRDPGIRKRFASLPRAPIRIICCELDKGINHGNILRIAECFRLEEVCFTPVPRKKMRDFSGCVAALKWQKYRWIPAVDAIQEAKSHGYTIYGLTLQGGAKALRTLKWRLPCAIVLGSEMEGLEKDVEKVCDELISIPLYGMVQSLNVAVTAGIVVEHCFSEYVKDHPDFLPARKASRVLVKKNKKRS
jgi:tRNA G18 (ribose-2'-O)-methylase SpoU